MMEGVIGLILMLLLAVFYIATIWIIFEKAGHAGWTCLIPIYNVYVQIEIAGGSLWWFLGCFIPIINIIVAIAIAFGIAKKFGKGAMFGLGLLFLGFIFYPVLAFGNARYID